MTATGASQRLLGITVLGDFLLSEGADAVLANLRRVGATAVAVNPTVTAPADEGTGTFQPPVDAGSSPRLFDRPLFGRHSLWVRSAVAFEPRRELYADSPYGPRTQGDLTAEHGHVIGEFVDRAADEGLAVYLQIGAVQPTGLRDEDRPRLPDGSLPKGRLADTASLASPAVRAYNRAYTADLFAEYPRLTGIRVDWPEYPCYTLGEVFQGFEPQVAAWCAESGEHDFEAARAAAAEWWDRLHGGLDEGRLRSLVEGDADGFAGLHEALRIRAALSADLLRDWRAAIDAAAGPDRELSANAFMTPFCRLTGFESPDGGGLPGMAHCESFAPKLYTMHWSQMIDFWGREVLASNPGLDESLLVRALVRLTGIDDSASARDRLDDWGYPAPDEPHPIPDGPQRTKLAAMKALCPSGRRMHALVHGYGPVDDFARRLRLVAESDADGCWINRYGYLGDPKLDVIRDVWR